MKTSAKTRANVKQKGRQMAPILQRETFRTSREMDFFSEKELVTQTGHEIRDWPLVVVKELMDNALDACEEANVAPVLDVRADASGLFPAPQRGADGRCVPPADDARYDIRLYPQLVLKRKVQ